MRSNPADAGKWLTDQETEEMPAIAVIGANTGQVHPLLESLEFLGCQIIKTTLARYLSLAVWSPSIVLLDQQGTDQELLKRLITLRKTNVQRGIIVIGRSVDIGLQAQFLEMGADDYVVWPFDVSDVLSRINVLLREMDLPRLPRHRFSPRERRI